MGRTCSRTADRRSLQCWNRPNRFVDLKSQKKLFPTFPFDFRNIYNSGHLHIALGGRRNRRHPRHGREDSGSTSLFHSDAGSVRVLSSGTHRIRFGSQASQSRHQPGGLRRQRQQRLGLNSARLACEMFLTMNFNVSSGPSSADHCCDRERILFKLFQVRTGRKRNQEKKLRKKALSHDLDLVESLREWY